ncbi:unnamed protein product [Symbiodinium necroappetens]|uniref:Uncharacterized protein n=1 Tax=Symbiodinium necroappetens TaxID=1628268 RepID=A0A813ARF1_9DINO|nr:unnamed protein product [Symbiodinium necroappetens]
MASEVSLGSPQKISTGKQGRVELQPPSHTWISWCILLAYLAVFVEGVALLANDHYGPEILPRVSAAQFHLCSIYVLEVAIALGPGWCAMSPGWTSGELIAHHVPYTFTVMLCFALNQQHKWTLPLVVVLLTPLNEGLFIANSLGAPGTQRAVRRAYGFSVIVLLIATEIRTWIKVMQQHWESLPIVLAGIVPTRRQCLIDVVSRPTGFPCHLLPLQAASRLQGINDPRRCCI